MPTNVLRTLDVHTRRSPLMSTIISEGLEQLGPQSCVSDVLPNGTPLTESTGVFRQRTQVRMSNSRSALFATVQRPPAKRRWGSFLASYIVQATAVLALVIYTVTAPMIVPKQTEHVDLVAPELDRAPKAARVKAKLRPATRIEPPTQIQMAHPKIEVPALQVHQPQRLHRIAEVAEVAQPQLSIPAPRFDSKVLTALPGPKIASKIIATNTFAGSSATPTLQKLAPQQSTDRRVRRSEWHSSQHTWKQPNEYRGKRVV